MRIVNSGISKKTFEEAMKELQELIRQFEDGSLSLEGAIAAYERGMALQQYCLEKLQYAKAKIEQVTPLIDS